MKRNHSGKIRFFLNVVTGQVKFITYEKQLTAEWIDVGAFYKFAVLKSDYMQETNTWIVYRGTEVIDVVCEWESFSKLEPDYFIKIIVKRVTKKLTR